MTWRVVDASGRVIVRTSSEAEAVEWARLLTRLGRNAPYSVPTLRAVP